MKNENRNYAKKYIGKKVKIQIDRPINSRHPKYGFNYDLNYGFLPNTKAPDGEEIDAYVFGVMTPIAEFVGRCVAVIHRLNDEDDKLVVAPENLKNVTDEEIIKAVYFQERWFQSEVIRK